MSDLTTDTDDDSWDVDDAHEDHRPERDFAASRQTHTHHVDGSAIAQALDELGLDDPNAREMITILETVRQAFGDKDEMLRRCVEDLENGMALFILELRRHPARFIGRTIRSITDPAERQRQLHELGDVYLALCEHHVTDHSGPVKSHFDRPSDAPVSRTSPGVGDAWLT